MKRLFAIALLLAGAAVRAQNVEIPSGRIESADREFTVLSQTSMTTPAEFREIVVKDANGFSVKLKDIAKVELGAREERNAAIGGALKAGLLSGFTFLIAGAVAILAMQALWA